MLLYPPLVWLGGLFATSVPAVSICDIKGVSFQTPLAGMTVQGVAGIVTAKDKYGFWIQDEQCEDIRASNGLRVYGSAQSVNVGDSVSLSGRVSEYRPAKEPNDLYLTELDIPHDIVVHSRGNSVQPVILGTDRTPPTGQLSAADAGPDGWLSIPNNFTLLESVNATVQPDVYGLDFWESLEGQLVTIPSPVAANFPDRFGSVWVHGDWPMSGRNARGGITLVTSGLESPPDAHAGAVRVAYPLDNTKNPRTYMGMGLSDITGIVTYRYGSYYVLPLTAPSTVSVPDQLIQASTITPSGDPCELTIGDYNVENMGPRSHHIRSVAAHIAHHLNAPDIVFVQEIQDDSGTRDDGTVSANKTLAALASAIGRESGGVRYAYANVEPEDGMDGGQPGGNIRVAYLWRPDRVSLVPGSSIGNATEATEVTVDRDGKLTLSLNPGRLDPMNEAWVEARKPIAAAWQTTSRERFFTVNVHYSSKRDSSSPQGDARPPVNGKSEQRIAQATVTADFVSSILARDPNASVVVGGDMNEFLQTRAVFAPFAGVLTDINDIAGVPPAERYTYVYDQHAQEIDHIFVSGAVAARGAEVEHVHVNTWAETQGAQVSDHDPSVARVRVCETPNETMTGPFRYYIGFVAEDGQVVL